ncbi:MAG: PspC domain-containing protein [Candidatus Aenigmarchaeota archaeon]|nr:PspC domain-containing protein [Candidatus Aenigmarchaeota archaeon]
MAKVVKGKAAHKKTSYKGKRLYRSGSDRILGGVCGGIAEYLGVDPTIIRILWILGILAWGMGVILYILFWLVIPRNPKDRWED